MRLLKRILPFCLTLVVGLSVVWLIARFAQSNDTGGVHNSDVAPVSFDKEATTLEPIYIQTWLEETCVAQEYEGPYGIGGPEFDTTGNLCVGQVKLRGRVSRSGQLSNVEVVNAAPCGLTERALGFAQKTVDAYRERGLVPMPAGISEREAHACVDITYQFSPALKMNEWFE